MDPQPTPESPRAAEEDSDNPTTEPPACVSEPIQGAEDLPPEAPAESTVVQPFNPFAEESSAFDEPEESAEAVASFDPLETASVDEGFAAPPALASETLTARVAADAARPDAAAASGPALLPTLIFSWASLATLLAGWLWWNRSPAPPTPAYLPTDAAIDALAGKVINPLDNLGDRMVLRLGETRRIGDVELTPQAIEHRKIRVLSADGSVGYEPCVLVLRLEAKNVSAGRTFAPFDPRFQTMVDKGRGRAAKSIKLRGQVIFEDGYTYSFAHPVGEEYAAKRRILPLDVDRERGERLAGQEFATVGPGETAEGWAVSSEDALMQMTGPMLWRVKIRKGMTTGGAGVAAVVGVRFARADVKMIDPEPPRVGDR